ncbi:MAG: hypothetical protein SV487_04800 [Thermodesulfobacteriota bacterium]|nr:hypothetical protein [Thermodesulfobacteriota bacterium]
MNIAPMEFWLLFQVVLEAIIVILIIFFLVRLRRASAFSGPGPRELEETLERFLSESEKLSVAFTENLKQKKELSLSLLLKLERKINEMNILLERAERNLSQAEMSGSPDMDKANPATPENRALVLKLAGKGQSVEEIARTARLHRGEVELILDLEKQFDF